LHNAGLLFFRPRSDRSRSHRPHLFCRIVESTHRAQCSFVIPLIHLQPYIHSPTSTLVHSNSSIHIHASNRMLFRRDLPRSKQWHFSLRHELTAITPQSEERAFTSLRPSKTRCENRREATTIGALATRADALINLHDIARSRSFPIDRSMRHHANRPHHDQAHKRNIIHRCAEPIRMPRHMRTMRHTG
jgi:hypothetical protein